MNALDPWHDAEHITNRITRPGAELWLAIGAESWCRKCADLRPRFEAARRDIAAAHAQVTWLWLDLEVHGEFVGAFIPEDLPLLLRWRDGQCVQAAVIEGMDPDEHPSARLRPVAVPRESADIWGALTEVIA